MPVILSPRQRRELDTLKGATISLFDNVLSRLNRSPIDGENLELEKTITQYGFTITVKIQIKA